MDTLIVYDSTYGNTETIAHVIANALVGNVQMVAPVSQVDPTSIKDANCLIVGSPVHGGRPTPEVSAWLRQIPEGSLKGVRVGAFDTRFAPEDHGFWLRILMYIIGYAAPRIATILVAKGGTLAAAPIGFIVTDKEGPLKNGELQRATQYAREMSTSAEHV